MTSSGGDVTNETSFDAILVVGFGGPEKRDDVIPFLENVTRGRNIPRERLLGVAEHYYQFGGVSPINQQTRDLIALLDPELKARGVELPVFWGNRNWHPMLEDTVREMAQAGVKRALALVLAAYSSYSSCRQYRENLDDARQAVGPGAPTLEKIRVFYNHPDFIAANADRVQEAIEVFPAAQRSSIRVAYTAHSLPMSMANSSDYVAQLEETARLVSDALEIGAERWKLVYQSRSGRPSDPWLEPDILDHLKSLHDDGVRNVVVAPIGFLSDHIEVLYDLDDEAASTARKVGLKMVRAKTVGTHPRFVAMLAELIEERLGHAERRAVGRFPANHDVCPENCCPRPVRPASRPTHGGSPDSP
jgi:ferrochelatase